MGIKFTYGNDGIITANGQNTHTDRINFWCTGYVIPNDYLSFPFPVKITGLPEGASTNPQTFWFGGSGVGAQVNGYIVGANINFTLSISIAPGYTCDNLIFKPMITPAYEDTNIDYSPYSMRVQDLTTNILNIKNDALKQSNRLLVGFSSSLRFTANDAHSNYKYVIRITQTSNFACFTGFLYNRAYIIGFNIYSEKLATSGGGGILYTDHSTIYAPTTNPLGGQASPSNLIFKISDDHTYLDIKINYNHYDLCIAGFCNNGGFLITEEDWYDDPEPEPDES